MDQNTENQVKQLLASLLAEGVSLSDAQTMINSELKVALTYMDIRIIASTLDVDWKKSDPHPVKSEEDAPAEENTDTAAGNPDEAGKTIVEINLHVHVIQLLSTSTKYVVPHNR